MEATEQLVPSAIKESQAKAWM